MRFYIICAIVLVVAFLQGCGFDAEMEAYAHYERMVCAEAWEDFYDRKPECPEMSTARPDQY